MRMMTEPAAFQSKLTGVMMCKLMDDGILFGPNEALDRTLAAMGKLLLLRISCPQLGSETKCWETMGQDRAGISSQTA